MSNPPHQLIFIIVVTNAGGQGKTLLARLCKSLWLMTGRPVELLDSDAGSAMARMFDKHAKRIGWGVDSSVASEIVTTCSEKCVVLDCGANLMASAREIVDLIPELARGFEAKGYRNVAFMPFTPNKSGAVGLLDELAAKLPPMEKIFVQNNADNSNRYKEGVGGCSNIALGNLQPGLFEYLNATAPASFFDVVKNPGPDRKLAGRFIGRWMHDFAKDASKHDLFSETLPILNAVKREPNTHFAIKASNDCTDKAIVWNQHKSQILEDIYRHGGSADGLFRASLDERSRMS